MARRLLTSTLVPPSLVCIAWLLTFSTTPTPEFAPDPLAGAAHPQRVVDPAQGFRAPSNYLHVSPGVLALALDAPEMRMYAWGVAGGHHFVRGKRFAAQVGGFFEHLVWAEPPSFRSVVYTTGMHFLRVGPEVRVGASGERVFGYGLARIGLDVMVERWNINGEYGSSRDGSEANVDFMASIGAGIQGVLGPGHRLILGAEPSFDVDVRAPLWTFKARVFLGWRF